MTDRATPSGTSLPAPARSARERGDLTGLARGGVLSLAGAAVSAVGGVLVVLLVTRVLPQRSAGVFFAVTSAFLIAGVVARWGTTNGLVYAISRKRALGSAVPLKGLLTTALPPVAAIASLIGLATVVWADDVAELIGVGGDRDAATALRVLGLLLPLTVLADGLLAATRGYGAILPTVIVDKVGRPVVQVAAVAAALGTGSIVVLSTAWAVPWLAAAVAGAWWLSRFRSDAPATDASPPGPAWREFWSFTAARGVTSVVQIALQRLDILLLAVLAGPVQAAVYTAATRFLVVGQLTNQALAAVVEPRLGRLLAVGDREASAAVYRSATAWLVLVSWPLYLLVALHAESVLSLFGAGYDAGAPAILVLCAAMLVATAIGMVDVVLIMGGRTTWNLGNAATALGVMVLVDLLLIPELGLLGAAIGWATAIVVKNVLPLVQVWRSLGLHPFGRSTVGAAALAVVSWLLIPLGGRALLGEGVVALLASVVLGAVVYVAGCWHWRGVLALDSLAALRRRSAAHDSARTATTIPTEVGP